MITEVLLYGNIYAESASNFINSLNDINDDDELIVRVNSDGGSPEYGFGMIAKFIEHKGKKTVKIDGKAYSAGAFFALYADNVEALDVSEFLIHRAAYPNWFEGSESFTDELKGNLERINGSLKKALESKVDAKLFEQITDTKISEIFAMDSRKDVFLTAKQAKELGIVTKINKITPAKKAEIEAKMIEVGASKPFITETEIEKEEIKLEKMDLNELKSKFPSVYAEAFNEGLKSEKDRVEAILVYQHIDAKGVKEAIESGEVLSAKAREEFALKAMTSTKLAALEAESAEGVVTAENPVKEKETKEDAELKAFMAEVDSYLKIEKK